MSALFADNQSTAPASVVRGAYEDRFGLSESRAEDVSFNQWMVIDANTAPDAYYQKVRIPGHTPVAHTKRFPVSKVIQFADAYIARISPDSDLGLDSKAQKAIALFTSWLNDESEDPETAQEEYEEIKKVLDESRTDRKLFP